MGSREFRPGFDFPGSFGEVFPGVEADQIYEKTAPQSLADTRAEQPQGADTSEATREQQDLTRFGYQGGESSQQTI